jgi:transcriptional regulator with XRE-family HTH domain
MTDRSTIAAAVASACTESAGTVQALAEEVGVSYAALCSWSRGRRRPPAHRLQKLAEVMDRRAERLQQLANELRQQAGQASSAAAADRADRIVGRLDAPPLDMSRRDAPDHRLPMAAAARAGAGMSSFSSRSPAEPAPRRSSSAIPLPAPSPRR